MENGCLYAPNEYERVDLRELALTPLTQENDLRDFTHQVSFKIFNKWEPNEFLSLNPFSFTNYHFYTVSEKIKEQ